MIPDANFGFRETFMIVEILLILLGLGVILAASAIFTNGVEHMGDRLNLHQGAVGSVLAAVGTALPETIIPVLAIFFYSDNPHANDIGIGAILGAPFMLATLGFCITGAAVLIGAAHGKRSASITFDAGVLKRDLSFFLVVYGVAVLVALVHETMWVKVTAAILLVLAYGWYVRKTLSSESAEMDECHPLYLSRFLKLGDGVGWSMTQVAISLGLMIAGAHFFVAHVGTIAVALGVSPLLLSLIITPIATELPEKFNSVIWIGQRKDQLALGNITGAMVFQSSIPAAIGIAFTGWNLDGLTLFSAIIALAAAGLVYGWVRVRGTLAPQVLLCGGLLYLIYLGAIILTR